MRGRDKLMELVDGMPLLRRQVLRALDTGCRVYVTLPEAPHSRYAAVDGLDIAAVAVPDAAEGMNASLRAGIGAVQSDCDAVMVLLADMPDVDKDDMNSVLQAIDLKTEKLIWRATTQDGHAGHPIVFHASLFPALLHLSGDSGGRAIVKEHSSRTVHVPLAGSHARTDLDTPEAWAAWRAKNASI